MGWFGRLFRRDIEAKSWGEAERRMLADIFGTRESATGRTITWKTALDVTTVFRCVQVLADGVATVPIKLMREDPATGRRAVASDHPVSWLLSHQPNEWQNSVEFRETLMTHLALTQNAFVFINRLGNGRIAELLPVEPGKMRVRALAEGGAAYRIVMPDGTQQPVPSENVWHIRARSWDGIMGLESVRLARESIGLALATEEQHARLHRHGVQSSGVYSVEGTLNKEQYEALRQYVDKQVGGLSNAGKALILDRAAKWTPTTMTGVDSEHLATRRFQIEEICRAFGVLPIMVGHANEQSTFASAEQMFLAHAVHTVRPWHRRWEASAAKALLTEAEIRAGYYVKFFDGELLRGAAKDRAEYYAKALGSGGSDGWLSPNDVRGFEDLNPKEGGDDVPRRAAGAAPASPDPTPGD
jgi:HK97 family phage portal protein